MQALIQAGGRGTRLFSLTNDEIPKPMIPLLGKPLIQWQLEALKRCGVREFVIVTGHLGHVIREYFGDGGRFGVGISYIEEPCPLGTAGALFYAREQLSGVFLLAYGDVLFDVDAARMLAFHREKNSIATLFAHPNSHPFDSDLVLIDGQIRVTGFDSKHSARDYWYDNLVNAGLFILEASALDSITSPEKLDLEQDLLAGLVRRGEPVYAYRSSEYIKDAGTVERHAAAVRDLESGLVERRNLKNRQSCIFFDRDGTLTKFNGLVISGDMLELETSAAKAVRAVNESGFLAACVTNQPVVARGMCSIDDVRNIHKKMHTLLGKEGAYLDDIEFCPHHPDRGYPEENAAYKIDCGCRKPKTGMIETIAKRRNIDLSRSWFVGDTTVDIQTGKNAGLKTALVLTGEAGRDGKFDVKSDIVAADVYSVVCRILETEAEL